MNRPFLSRRTFLQSGVAATLVASVRSGQVMAQGAPDPIFWVQVFATGGWDPMLFCDPKFGPRIDQDGGFHSVDQLQLVAGIEYVDAWTQGYPAVRPIQPFFQEFGERLLVLNGLDMTTNNHDVGTRYAMSGSLLEGFPIFAAQVAAVHGADRVLPLVDISGYDECGGLVAPVRLDYVGVPTISVLRDPNDPPQGLWRDDVGSTITAQRYLAPGPYARLQEAAAARLARVTAARRLPAQQQGLAAWERARAAMPGISGLELPSIGSDGLENWKALATMGIRAFRGGLATSMTVAAGGPNLDSHGIPDWEHLETLDTALQVAAHVANTADDEGVPCVVIMCSEFGRTPVREPPGSGHWPVGSMMILQNQVVAAKGLLPAGQVIGGTTGAPEGPNDNGSVFLPRRIHPVTHTMDDAGITLSPAHVYRALRRVAGVADSAVLAGHPIPIEGKDLELG